MGGANESVLNTDPATTQGSVLPADPTPETTVEPTPQVVSDSLIPPEFPFPTVNFDLPTYPVQTQAIRQHLNSGQIHLHVDGDNPLKVAIPVAEWFVIMRNLRSLTPFTFIDSQNKCVAYLKPYIHNAIFEVAIELAPIEIGERFTAMTTVAGR